MQLTCGVIDLQADERGAFAKVPDTFARLVKEKGVSIACNAMLALIFPDTE
jgi:hypothetical protein